MWGSVPNVKEAMERAFEFTGNASLYGQFMQRVTKEWPVSCENALTDYALNRKAWVGHAAVALALQIPEDITRAAWAKLTYEQQLLANKEASRAIQTWEHAYIKDRKLYLNLGAPLLFGWDT
jgi:hypothetical protein